MKFCLVLLAWLAGSFTALVAQPPNIVLILTDDIGWGDFRCYNPASKIPAPNIEKLAQAGMRFTDAHTPAALCSPTRYAMLTGNYPWRGLAANGVWDFDRGTYFLPGQKTIGHLLQAAGYRTAMFGKINVGGVFEHTADGKEVDWSKPMTSGPLQWGFDYSYILSGGHALPPFLFLENNRVAGDATKVTELKKGPQGGGMIPSAGPGLPDFDSSKVGELILTKAIAFLDEHLAKNKAAGKDQPFYLHFCTDGSHSPYTPPEHVLGTPVKGASQMTEHTDMVVETDVLLGKLTAALEQRGLLANTLLVFTSDNGGLPFERECGHDAVGGLRGCKSFIYEGGHRVPFLVRWGDGTAAGSKIAPGSVRQQLIGAHDAVATFAEVAGAKPGADQARDSISLLPVLLGQRDDRQPVRQTLLVQGSPNRDAFAEAVPAQGQSFNAAYAAVGKATKAQGAKAKGRALKSSSDHMPHALREGDWKLTLNIVDQPAALYNLAEDLAEKKNLIADAAQAERVHRMGQLYREQRAAKRSTPPLLK